MIRFKNFSLFYEGEQYPSLKEIDLTINDGEFVVITGLSGCGKTSLLRVINGLYPSVFEGRHTGLFEMDQDVVGSVLQDSKSGFLFQELNYECMFPSICMKRKKEDILFDLDLQHIEHPQLFSNKDSLKLSSGQAQLLSILSIRMKRAKVILMDEPTANLDAIEISNLISYLKELKEEGYTIVIAEHRIHYFEMLWDRVLYLENGEFVEKSDAYQTRKKEYEFCNRHCLNDGNDELEIRNITYAYGNRSILNNVSVTCKSGNVVGVVGLNGSGKSTFAKVICGLVKSKCKSISLNHVELSSKQLEDEFYYCMQDAYKQMVSASLKEELLLQDPSLSEKQIQSLLEIVDLQAYMNKQPSNLSSGQVQRLSILLAYVSKCRVVVLDEPTSGLDYKRMMDVVELIDRFKQDNRFVFVISHDMEFMSYVMDSCIYIDQDGCSISYETMNEEVFKSLKQKLQTKKEENVIRYEEEKGNRSKINPIVNIVVFFAMANAIFMYPYNQSSVYLLLVSVVVLLLNQNYKLACKEIIVYSVMFVLKQILPIAMQVVVEIFLLRGICARYAFLNIMESSNLLRVIESFGHGKKKDYILLPLVCMLRIFPTFQYDASVCYMSLKTRGLLKDKNMIHRFLYLIVPLIHALMRTAENLASSITTKGFVIGKERTMIYDSSFKMYDGILLGLFFVIYLSLILKGISV